MWRHFLIFWGIQQVAEMQGLNDYGNSVEDVHMQVLGFIKPNLHSNVYVEAYNHLQRREKRTIDGIESILSTEIADQLKVVSYFCKNENIFGKDTYKRIKYSIGFRSKIENFIQKPEFRILLLSNALRSVGESILDFSLKIQ